jgi:4-amino-4-deoxy-L-arabinose transferase-like glycosyltransferase
MRAVGVGTLTGTRGARDRASAPRTFALDRDMVALALLIALAAALRFWRLRHQGFWFDEANTSQEVHFRPGEMVTLLKHYESTPPFYYAVAWVWARIFGFGEAGLRSLSALCGVLVVPLSYALGSKLFSRRAGLVAAALAATSPLLIWYSQEARAYELAVLLAGISILAFLYADEAPSPLSLTIWVLSSALAIATEYYAALVVVPAALWLIYRHRRERPLQVAIGALTVCGAPLLWFAVSQNATRHASWIKHLPLGPRIGQIFPQFLIGFGAPGGVALSWLAAVIAVIGIGLLVARARDTGDPWRRSGLIVGGILAAGIVLNGLLLAVGVDNLLTRNVVVLWLPAALLTAGGLATRRGGIAGAVLTALLCGAGVAAAVGVAVDRKYQRPDWRPVAHVLGLRPAPGVNQRAILIQGYRDVLPLSLYMPGLQAWSHTGTDAYSLYRHDYTVSELDVIAISSPPAPRTGCWWGSACNLIPTALQSSYAILGFRPVWVRHAHQFTILRMVASRPVVVSPQMVSSALSNTQLKYDDLLVQCATAGACH